jgi:hypothetical protein
VFTNRKAIRITPTNQRTVAYHRADHVTFSHFRIGPAVQPIMNMHHLLLSITKRRAKVETPLLILSRHLAGYYSIP